MEVSETTLLVVDNGLFFGFAQQLAKSFKRVLYHFPGWERGFCTIRDGAIGDGYRDQGVELCEDIWEQKDQFQLAAFPDIGHSGLQLELESQGKLVWGSRKGDTIELLRKKFLKVLKDVGMEVPKHVVIKGLDALRVYLRKNDNKFIKISKWRGDMETHHHINYDLSLETLDEWAVRFGPLQNEIEFLVFEPIDAIVEDGYDGYSIDGWYPNKAVHGIEKKDAGYIGAVQHYDDLPEQIREVNERMSEVLASYHYRNFWSSEIRIEKDKFTFIDPCCRAGLPSGDAQFVLYKNLPEIILRGAAGDVVEPEFEAEFVCQVMIHHKGDTEHWRCVQVPEDVTHYVRLFSPVKTGPVYGISPSSVSGETVGTILGIGDTIEDAINHLKENADKLKDNPISIETDALSGVLQEMQSARKEGVELTHDKIPDPAIVLEAD